MCTRSEYAYGLDRSNVEYVIRLFILTVMVGVRLSSLASHVAIRLALSVLFLNFLYHADSPHRRPFGIHNISSSHMPLQ